MCPSPLLPFCTKRVALAPRIMTFMEKLNGAHIAYCSATTTERHYLRSAKKVSGEKESEAPAIRRPVTQVTKRWNSFHGKLLRKFYCRVGTAPAGRWRSRDRKTRSQTGNMDGSLYPVERIRRMNRRRHGRRRGAEQAGRCDMQKEAGKEERRRLAKGIEK